MRRPTRLTAGLVAAVVLGGAGCGGGDEPAAPEAAVDARSGGQDVDRFLAREGEQPGFRPDGDASTVVGVNAITARWGLPPAESQQLRDRGFVSFTTRGTLGPRESAGVSEVLLFATDEGARDQLEYDLRASTIHATLPDTKIRRFTVSGVPGARLDRPRSAR